MDNEKTPKLNGPSRSISVPVSNEANSEVRFHVASSLTRRGPLWPQSFEHHMDNKICSPSSIHRYASRSGVDFEHVGDEDNSETITTAAVGGDSDLKEPLLRKGETIESCLGKTRSTDLECGRRIESGGTPGEAGFGDVVHKEAIVPSGSSFLQATLNGVNVLAGVGILSTPYALSQGGWLSLSFLLAFAAICLYTGILLRRCLDIDEAIITYPDIGQAAFGRKGRLLVSILLYFELYCVAVEFLILEGDNLANLFPFPGVVIGNTKFTSHQVYVVVSALCMLPTLLLRDLSLLSYISAGGVIATLGIVSSVGYVGAVEGVGFHNSGTLLNVSGLPVAVGVYAFCFCGHAVFPNIYRSMKHRQDFSKVLLVCFVLVTIVYAGIGVLGYTMFGDEVQSQVTLNLPNAYLSSRVAIWITLVNPVAKYALVITPLAAALEEFLPWSPKSREFFIWSTGIRGGLAASTVLVALAVPFFGYMMAFIGSFLSVSVAIILPCVCYLRIFGRRGGISWGEVWALYIILLIGLATAFIGTYSAILGIIGSFDHLMYLNHLTYLEM